jgi:nucleoside-diphosphate-sugar epimerase
LPRTASKPSRKRLRVALTGATGFSGRFILAQLLAAGHDVIALARRPEVLKGKGCEIVVGDLASAGALAQLVEGADVALHVGGATAAAHRQGYFDVNVEGTKRLFEAVLRAKIRRFIYISSVAARDPISDYGASKEAAEAYLLPFDGKGCSVLALRPPVIYGPTDKATLPLFRQLQSPVAFVPSGRNSRFSLLYVEDFAQILCDAVSDKSHGLYELDDGGGGYDWLQVAKASRAGTGYPGRLVFLPRGLAHLAAGMIETFANLSGKPTVVNRQKVKELYHDDWTAKGQVWSLKNPVSLQAGLARTVAWYQAEGWLPAKSGKARSAA